MSSSKRKKDRRQLRYERNVLQEIEHKNQAWVEGKLIEENHNQGPYSVQYTEALAERLYQYICQEKDKAWKVDSGDLIVRNKETGESLSPGEVYLRGFRKYKIKIQDLILHWNPNVEKNNYYEILKKLLEVYWDEVVTNNNPDALNSIAL